MAFYRPENFVSISLYFERISRVFCVACLGISIISATPVLATNGELHLVRLEHCPLSANSADEEASCTIGYRAYGARNDSGSNIILAFTSFGATSELYEELGYIGPGKTLDTDRYQVIVIDAFGNGVSHIEWSHDDVAEGRKETLSFKEMAHAQHHLVANVLSIREAYALFGLSMGGMQVFAWAHEYPNFARKKVSVVGSVKSGPFDQVTWRHRLALMDTLHDHPDYVDIMATASTLAFLSPNLVASRVAAPGGSLEIVLDEQREFARQQMARSFRVQVIAIINHDATSDLKADSTSGSDMLVIVAPDDRAVTPHITMQYAADVGMQLEVLPAGCGHIAVFCYADEIHDLVGMFLN